jgi:hypothetical protein
MGENFMLLSRLGLISVVLASCMSFIGVANADMYSDSSYDGYNYNGSGVYIPPVPASPMFTGGAYHHGCYAKHHHHYKHMARYMHRGCPMYRGYYVCTMYTLEITPIHRDVACSKWVFSWKPMSHRPWKV